MLALLGFLLFAPGVSVSSLAGNWATQDKSVVQVLPCGGDGTLCIKIAAIGRSDVPRTDRMNPDASQQGRALCGLTIGTGFVPDGMDKAKDGKIYDPNSGKTYSAQMQGQGDTLKLRGYIGVSLLGRTETWHRAADTLPACR